MPKKILLYTDTTLIGGAENHMLNLVRFLDRKKFTPLLLCSGHDNLNEWCKKMKDAGAHVMRLIAKNKHNPRHYFSLKRILEEEKIDLLHAHIWNPASSRYAYLAAKSRKKPLVTTEHDPFLLSPFKNWIKKKLLKNTTHVIAISDANKEFLRKNYPVLRGKISTVHNGLDITWFESQLLSFSKTDCEKFRREHFKIEREEEKKISVVTCIAELHARKGLPYLLEAAKILTEKNPTIKIVIAGKGPQKKTLERFIKKCKLEKNVILLGHRKDIPHILASSDFFVLPSLNEAFGLVLLEAMAAKLPIVATKNGGIPEIIENNVTGLLVPPRDGKALAYALLRLIQNPNISKRLAEGGNAALKKKFDIQKMVKNTEEVYTKVLVMRAHGASAQ